MISKLFIALGVFFLVSAHALALDTQTASDVPDIQSSENLMSSKAVQLFILRKYEDALTEFRVLSEQYPNDIVIQRYIGASLSGLRRDDEAFLVFDDILRSSPNDLPTYKYLAKMHLRRGETDRARERLEKLVEMDTTEQFSSYAKAQLKELDTIESSKLSDAAITGRQIDPDEFLKTKAATHFMDAEYEKAIPEFEALEAQYPQDTTVRRYKGMTLDKLGRYDEAIEVFNKALEITPNNAALSYALAQSYYHKKDIKASADLLRAVSASDFGNYKMKADRDLEAIERVEALIRRAEGKPLSFSVEQGFEINSNAASEPKKRQVPAEEHAVRFPGSLSANYKIKKNGPLALSASYTYYQAFYSDTLDYLNTIVNAPAFSLMREGEFYGKAFFAIYSTGYTHVSVEDEFYYQSYPQTLRFIYSFWDWHRVILSERIAWTDYKDQGFDPTTTSREGVSNAFNVTNNIYFNDKRDKYVGVGYEYKVEDTDGSSYVRNAHQVNTDLNFQIALNFSATVYFRYKQSDYPETTGSIQRLDEEFTTGVSVSKPLNNFFRIKLYYDYTNNDSNDPIFNYVNNASGMSLSCNF